jgi:hypothetical protein
MPSTNRNDLMPTYEKLEWVTPKISLMGAGDADGKVYGNYEPGPTLPQYNFILNPVGVS